ncbi:MAG: hypothetical protein ACYC6Y_19600 [Thermoguttaceae bacterium]
MTTMGQRNVVVGVFEDRRMAQEAIQDLKRSGFSDDLVGVASRDIEDAKARRADQDDDNSGAAEGAAIGAATGAGVGGLWGIAIAAGLLPAIGPVIAGGILASVLASAGLAAAVGGIAGALTGLGVPEDEAKYYEGEFQSGRTVVTVKAGDRFTEAASILQRHGAYDMHNRYASSGSSATGK